MNFTITKIFIVFFLFIPFTLLSQYDLAQKYAERKRIEFIADSTQTVDIYFYGLTGKLNEMEETLIVPEVQITLIDLYGEASQLSSSEDMGFYHLDLKFDNKYKIFFESPDMYTKYLEIDTRDVIDIEQERGYIFRTDITMVPADDFDIKALYLKKPVGKAYYDRRIQMLTWDLDYTDKLNVEVDKIKSKKKKR